MSLYLLRKPHTWHVPEMPEVPVDLLKVWADAPVEVVSLSPHLITSACLSGSHSHVKLKAATDALFKVSSKMVLKCGTQLFHWRGQGIYGEVVFPLDGGGGVVTRSHYLTPVWMSKGKQWKKKTLKKLLYQLPPSLSRHNLPGYFLHEAVSLPSASKDHRLWPRASKSWSKNCPEQRK